MIAAVVALWSLVVCAALGMAFGVVILRRNHQVHRFSLALLDRIHEMGDEEIARGDYTSWERRAAVRREVSYDRMVREFWRPLPWFYQGTILEDIAREIGKVEPR